MSTEPWKRPPPVATNGAKRQRQKLTDAEKARARARADAAGRRYPNLVDNMWVIAQRTRDAPPTD